MPQNKINILSTRLLEDSLIDEANKKGIHIEVLSFIETETLQNTDVQQEIEQALLQSAAVVFTSMNAVDAVANYQDDQQPDWRIYCFGATTSKLVQKYFGEESIAGTASNAAELADLIANESDFNEVVFFCGDRRRDELPDILRSNNIKVNEIMVYQTIAVPHKIERQYDGILFFSPSAVESYLKLNTIKDETCFCIGETTAEALEHKKIKTIIIADKPSIENVIETVLQNYNNH